MNMKVEERAKEKRRRWGWCPAFKVFLQTKEEVAILDFIMRAVSMIIIISYGLWEDCTSFSTVVENVSTIKSYCRRNDGMARDCCDLPRNFYNVFQFAETFGRRAIRGALLRKTKTLASWQKQCPVRE